MQAFDASSIVYAWDNYPPSHFPHLWKWLSQEIKSKKLVISEVAFEEVKRKFPDPEKWLKDQDISKVAMSIEALHKARQIKDDLGLVGDNYHGKGVGENDILIVASACVEGHELVTNEERQPTLPKNLAKMKIPAVCAMESVSVPCMTFLELMKNSGEVFG